MGGVHTKRLKNWSIVDSCWWRKRCVSTINLSYLRIVSQTFRSTEVYLRPTSFWSEESKLQMRVSPCEHYSSVIAHNSRLTFNSVNGKKNIGNFYWTILNIKGVNEIWCSNCNSRKIKRESGMIFGELWSSEFSGIIVGSNVVN